MGNKQTAINLVERFRPYTIDQAGAIECALICLDELRDASLSGYDYDRKVELPYYDEIEKEIKSIPYGKLYYMNMKFGNKNE